jgi:type II secretory pathway pseudopilin PulG
MLIELLVVVIAILAALAVPNLPVQLDEEQRRQRQRSVLVEADLWPARVLPLARRGGGGG